MPAQLVFTKNLHLDSYPFHPVPVSVIIIRRSRKSEKLGGIKVN